jgi:carbamoyltransferase
MIVMGLHFGHDANICILRNGAISFHYVKERYNRIRHANVIDAADVEFALKQANVRVDNVDFCAITSTQGHEYLFVEPRLLSAEIDESVAAHVPSPFLAFLKQNGMNWRNLPNLAAFRANAKRSPPRHFQQYAALDVDKIRFLPSFEAFFFDREWIGKDLAGLGRLDCSAALNDIAERFYHLPVRVNLLGRAVPGAMISHHYAHAAYAHFESDFEDSAIISHDGAGSIGNGIESGMFYYARDNHVFPLAPHFLSAAYFYEMVGSRIGLGDGFTAPGKMMGLAAYGQPKFYDSSFVGNWFDQPRIGAQKSYLAWIEQTLATAASHGYDMSALADPNRMVEPINVDIAASAQRLFEDVMLKAVQSLRSLLEASKIATERLVLTGGAALNCPTNTRIFNDGSFRRVEASPAVDDSGLAIGSSYALYHCILQQPRSAAARAPFVSKAYRGAGYGPEAVADALDSVANQIVAERVTDAPRAAAGEIAADHVIGWFLGASEIGPRALGHRSILAHPGRAENWKRVNIIKRREWWRPFAPAVLTEFSSRYFDAAPANSPYMLFNAEVISDEIPAVCHVDRTARIQTVDAGTGDFRLLLEHFYAVTGIAAVLNTSLNGPGQPIIQTPSEALDFFLSSPLDALYLDGWRVTHNT